MTYPLQVVSGRYNRSANGQKQTLHKNFHVEEYQWFVVRGRISLWSEAPNVMLEFDPEGSAYCVLSAKDASELAQIVMDRGRDPRVNRP